MGKKSRRQRVPNAASRRGPTPVTIDTAEDDAAPTVTASTLSPERRAAAIAAAEAECWAALESAEGGVAFSPETHPRLFRANLALVDAISLGDDDRRTMAEYMSKTFLRSGVDRTAFKLIKATMRWPRIRKYWPRIRRRICSGCGKQYDLSEPRLLVCGECGEGRYCDKACQRAHWPGHRGPCLKTFLEQAKERRSRWDPHGKTIEKLRQDFLELYPR